MADPLQKFRSDVSSILSTGRDCFTICKWAFLFKILMLVLQVRSENALRRKSLCKFVSFIVQIIANVLIPDHQGSMNDVFMRVHRHPDHDIVTETLLGGFDNWDAEYYIYIAQHGYTFLQSMAFFPFYPMSMWLVGRVALFPLSFLLGDRSLFLLAGTLVNLSVFPLAALSLYLLTLFVTDNQRFSIVTVLLFCVNPASVFMSAVYTESLFAFCIFTGLCLLARRHCWSASLLFSAASATRANGFLLAGFIGFHHLHSLYISVNKSKSNWIRFAMKSVFVYILQCTVVVLPFFLFQFYGYWKFCHVAMTTGEHEYEWCHWTLPLSYSFIQDHYWNVGFLRYYELKQIPNFLLALPVVILSLYGLWRFIYDTRNMLKVFKSDYQ